MIKSEIVLWTAGFVLMTLLINVPLLPIILRKTGLSAGKTFKLSHRSFTLLKRSRTSFQDRSLTLDDKRFISIKLYDRSMQTQISFWLELSNLDTE